MNCSVRVAMIALVLALLGCQAQPVARHTPAATPVRRVDVRADAVRLANELFGTDATQDPYRHDWQAAIQHATVDEGRQSYPLLIDLIASTRFDDLSEPQRHAGLLLAGLVGIYLADNAYAYHLMVRASAMPQARGVDWQARLIVANSLNDRSDCLLSITTLARQWPADLRALRPEAIARPLRPEPENDAQRGARFQALNALFAASYKVHEGVEPGELWESLVEELARRGELDHAARVVARINQPRELLALRIDRRFDALVRKNPALFDLPAASRREVAERQRAVRKNPRSLDAVVQLSTAYLDVGRYSDVLTLTQNVTAHVTAAGGLKELYDDGPDLLHWLYENRARSLEYLHRGTEAEQEYLRPASELVNGRRDISDVINLAEFYSDQDRSEAALDLLREVPQETGPPSPYGAMQVYSVRLRVALSTHDDREVTASLKYLRDHQQDALGTYQDALVSAALLDDAAALLIRRLQAPTLRHDALLAVQHYLPIGEPPALREDDARWERMVSRPEVTAAIDAVGRRETVALPP